ncbi:MAG: hypothetical protein JSV49_11415 [Thermoplasmata archaeon]|nr:MAG: hypothetical protein JSV49_11415 [Thermoplasmata archaeon]
MNPEKSEEQLIKLEEFENLLEMEMEEFDPLTDKYLEVSTKMEKLMKNLVLAKISNKRNELNILYLFQKMNEKKVNSENFENIFRDLDNIFTEVNNNDFSYDELITKNNDMIRRINPMIKDLLK